MIQSPLELGRSVLEIEAQAILTMKNRLGESFEQAVRAILDCRGKLVVTGIGKSGQIARKIASTFSSTGTPAIFLHPAESAHGDLGIVEPEDLILALSYGGNTLELTPVLSFAARKGNLVISLTGQVESELARKSQIVLDVRVEKEACPLKLAPTASSTAMLAMGDALAMVVLEQKGFRSQDFAENHPGGGLGLKLSMIKDLMHSGASLPLLSENASMKDILATMSRGDVRGAAGILGAGGELVGIITDGDIRRILETTSDPFQGVARDFMGRNPRTIDASELAEKALFMMEQFRIQVLFVLDRESATPKSPVGIIHIQDLLKAKVR